MKKKLREQIKALAHKLIAEENSFNTTTVKGLVAEVYEKISVLEYLESQIGSDVETTSSQSLDSKSFREENWFTEPEPLPQHENKEDLVVPLMEKIKDLVAQMPEEADQVDELLKKVIPQNPAPEEVKKQSSNDLEEFAANYQQMPVFERKEASSPAKVTPSETQESSTETSSETKSKSINETLNQGMSIGLNDRLAFIKHLFDGNTEDYTRVLSQINTMDSFNHAESFIKGKIKPDYNYWLNKDEYSERFMAIIEKKFN